MTCDPSSKGSVLGEGGVICLILTLNCFQYTIVEEIMEFEASRMIRRWSPKIRWCLLACFLTVRFWNRHHQESLEKLWGVNDRMTIIIIYFSKSEARFQIDFCFQLFQKYTLESPSVSACCHRSIWKVPAFNCRITSRLKSWTAFPPLINHIQVWIILSSISIKSSSIGRIF